MFFFFRQLYYKLDSYFFNYTSRYPLPKGRQGYFFSFGFLFFFFLLIEILSGILLAMFYIPHTDKAFSSIDHLMHEVSYGWIIRSMHEQSTHFFFFIIFILLFKGIYYKKYTTIKSMFTWVIGFFIFLLFLFTAFIGRILPWSMFSYYSAIIITNLFNVISTNAVFILWGGFSINCASLNRFFCLHYLLPFLCFIIFVFYFYLFFSREPIIKLSFSENALRYKKYFFIKDITLLCFFILSYILFIYLNPLEKVITYIQANVLFTHKPLILDWYLLPFFTILRSFIRWDLGLIYLFFIFLIFYLLPRIDVPSKRYAYIHSPLYKITFWFFTFNFIFLGYLGTQPAIGIVSELTIFSTWVHFFYLMFIMPCCFIFDTFLVGIFKRVVPRPISRLERYRIDLLRQDEYDEFRWSLFTLIFEKTALDVLKILNLLKKKDPFLRRFLKRHKKGSFRNYWVKDFLKSGSKYKSRIKGKCIVRRKIKKKPLNTVLKLLKKKKN